MEQRAYQSGLVQQAGFQPKKRAKFDKQRAAFDAQAQRNQATQAQTIRDNNAVNQANVRQSNKDLEALSAFSSTLTEKLVEDKQKKNEEEMQRGVMMAYTEGVPQEQQDSFDSEEQELNNLNESTIKAANKIEGKTGNVFLGEKVRSMSGWAAYGYAMGKAQNGGQEYALFQAQAADTVVNVTTESGEVKPLTLASANTPAEYAAVQSQIRSEFLKQYSGMNPALLNKYLFPSMRDQESKALIKFSRERGEAIKKDRTTRASDLLTSAINSATNPGEAALSFINQTAGDLGGRKEARAEALRVIRLGIKSGAIDKDTAIALANSEITIEGLGRKKVKEMWAEFGDLEQEVINEGMKDFKAEQAALELDAQKYAQNAYKNTVGSEQEGNFLTEAEKDLMIQESQRRFGYVNPILQNLKTKGDLRDEDAEILIQNKLRAGLGLTPSDLRGVSSEMFQKYRNEIKVGGDSLAISKRDKDFAEADIISAINEILPGNDGIKEKTQKWTRVNRRAQNYFLEQYQLAALASENSDMAYDVAMKKTLARIESKSFEGKYKGALNLEYGDEVKEGKRTLARWSRSQTEDGVPFYTSASTQLIPDTEDDIQVLIDSVKHGNFKIPPIYKQLASGIRILSAFDLARAQYMAATGEDLVPPAAEQVTGEMDAEFQRLLKYRPTSARTRQAMVGTGDRRFLDLVASEESEAFGGYDAYNKGGNYNGTVAYGSGNSAEDNRYGKPISQLTVGEIRKLQADGQLHAAGRYQFIKGTFAEVADELGLSNDTVFDAATQDRMAISRARWRVNHYGLKSLNQEWVGLRKVSQSQINSAYASIDPYNQPDVLTPGLRKLAYVTGDIGPTSTGEHLDVKDASGQRFHHRALDKYVEIDDPEFGTISLGDLREKTGFVGDSFDQHKARGSHGIDYGSASGSKVYVKNGATVVGSVPTEHGDKVTIQLPTGKQYTFLHGNSA